MSAILLMKNREVIEHIAEEASKRSFKVGEIYNQYTESEKYNFSKDISKNGLESVIRNIMSEEKNNKYGDLELLFAKDAIAQAGDQLEARIINTTFSIMNSKGCKIDGDEKKVRGVLDFAVFEAITTHGAEAKVTYNLGMPGQKMVGSEVFSLALSDVLTRDSDTDLSFLIMNARNNDTPHYGNFKSLLKTNDPKTSAHKLFNAYMDHKGFKHFVDKVYTQVYLKYSEDNTAYTKKHIDDLADGIKKENQLFLSKLDKDSPDRVIIAEPSLETKDVGGYVLAAIDNTAKYNNFNGYNNMADDEHYIKMKKESEIADKKKKDMSRGIKHKP